MSMRKLLGIVSIGLALFAGKSNGAEKMMSLVKNGKANVVVVLREEPNGVQIEAAKVMADHLSQISGAKIKVIQIEVLETPAIKDNVIIPDAGVTDVENFIFIGDGDVVRFNLKVDTNAVGYGGFIVKTFPNSIVFAGRDNNDPGELFTCDNRYTPYSRGTLYAVTWFLGKYLGVKYLWPGELGKVVPKNANIAIPKIDYSVTPKLRQRQIRTGRLGGRGQKGLDWLRIPKHDFYKLKNDAQKTVSASSTWRAWHHLGGTLGAVSGDGLVLPEEAWKTWPKKHPEWFAMQLDGDRTQFARGKPAQRPRLCLSNLDLIDAIAKLKIEKLKRNPEQRCVSIEPNDGGYMGFCMCEKCKALDAPNARKVRISSWDHKANKSVYFEYPAMTDRMVYFYNEIAKRVTKEFPDMLLLVAQYSAYSAAPLKRKLHPNIMVRFVGESFNWESERELKMKDWKEWSKMASKIFYRPNVLCQGYHQGFPLVNFSHKFAEDFKYMADNSMLGTDFDSIFKMWSTQGLDYYVIAELNWNPYANVDEIIDDYCKGFGKGWKHIRKYWDDVETITNLGAVDEKLHMLDPFTPKRVAKLAGYLDAAVKEAGGDEGAVARIAFLRSGLDFTDMQAKAFRMSNKVKADRKDAKLKAEGKKVLNEKWTYMRDLFMRYPMSIDPGLARFYSGRCFYYLGSRIAKETIENAGAIKYKPQGTGKKILEADEKGRLLNP